MKTLEVGISPMQTHEAREDYQQTAKIKTVEPWKIKYAGLFMSGVYLVLLLTQPILAVCYHKYIGTLLFGFSVTVTLMRIYIQEEEYSTQLKSATHDKENDVYNTVEVETVSFSDRQKIFAAMWVLSGLLTYPFDFLVSSSVREKIDCRNHHETNTVKLWGISLMIFNMSLLLGRIVVIKMTSLNCLRYISVRKQKLFKRVSKRLSQLKLDLEAGGENKGNTRLTFLNPRQQHDEDDDEGDDFFKALITKHNEIVSTNTNYLLWLVCLFIAQAGYNLDTYHHEKTFGPNDVQQITITFLTIAVLGLSLMSRLSYMGKIYANENIVNEEAAAVESLSSDEVKLVIVTVVTLMSALVGRAIEFFNNNDIF